MSFVNLTFYIYDSSVITRASFKVDTGESLYYKCSKPPEGTTHVVLMWTYVLNGKSCRRNDNYHAFAEIVSDKAPTTAAPLKVFYGSLQLK